MEKERPGAIERFESWLTPGKFLALLILLIGLNVFVYYWWMNKPLFPRALPTINTEMLRGLKAERDRLLGILSKDCDQPEMRAYQRGDIGPLRPDRGDQTSPQVNNQTPNLPLPHQQLLGLLQASSVMVKTNTGHGSGFFIDKKTVVTNRHVIDDASPDAIFITSKHLGPTPLKAKLVASTTQGETGDADFAILYISNAPPSVKPLAIAKDPEPLQNIVAVGYPGATIRTDANQNNPEMIFSTGVVSSLQPQPNGMIWVVHGADIAGGSSGGGLVDRCGNVLGVNTFVTSGRNQFENRGLYALASSSLRSFLDKQGQAYQKFDGQCAATSGN